MNAKLADFSELSKFLSLKVQVGFILFSFLLWEGAEAEPQHTEKKAETSIFEGISLGLHYFADAKIGGASESKINHDLFCASLGLHYFADAKIGGASEMNAKTSCFALHFSRLALSLRFKRRRISEKNHPACICHLWHMDSHVWTACLQRFLLRRRRWLASWPCNTIITRPPWLSLVLNMEWPLSL